MVFRQGWLFSRGLQAIGDFRDDSHAQIDGVYFFPDLREVVGKNRRPMKAMVKKLMTRLHLSSSRMGCCTVLQEATMDSLFRLPHNRKTRAGNGRGFFCALGSPRGRVERYESAFLDFLKNKSVPHLF